MEKFVLVDTYSRTNKDKKYYIAVLYSSFHYITSLFVNEEQFSKLQDYMYEDVSNFLVGFYDNKSGKVRYLLNPDF